MASSAAGPQPSYAPIVRDDNFVTHEWATWFRRLQNASTTTVTSNGLVTRTTEDNFTTREITATADEISITNGDGIAGNPLLGVADNVQLPGTEGLNVAGGTTAQRPGTPIEGDLRKNTSTNELEYYDGSTWHNTLQDTVSVQATQAAIEAETNENTYIPPDLIKHSPGVAKGWIKFDGQSTVTIDASYNVNSITDVNVGRYDVYWDTDFSSADYGVTAGFEPESLGSADGRDLYLEQQAAGSIRVHLYGGTTPVDCPALYLTAHGDQ